MSRSVRRVIAALLVISGGLVLVSFTDDRFIQMFIVACILFAATLMGRRTQRLREKAELHARLLKEIEEEEARASEETIDVSGEFEEVEDTGDSQPQEEPQDTDEEQPE